MIYDRLEIGHDIWNILQGSSKCSLVNHRLLFCFIQQLSNFSSMINVPYIFLKGSTLSRRTDCTFEYSEIPCFLTFAFVYYFNIERDLITFIEDSISCHFYVQIMYKDI